LRVKDKAAGPAVAVMNQRDQELLNKQFRWLVPPPRAAGVSIFTMLAIAATIGVSIGTIAIARQTQPAQIASDLLTKPSCLQFSKGENLPRLH
jgi:hypothetical protein